MSDNLSPNADAKIIALGALLRLDDADKVVPLLGKIALDGELGPAVQAVFTLAQSQSPKAHETVVRVAKTASEPVRVAAVRDLGRFGGPEISKELLAVYTTAPVPVKLQIVDSLGERAEQKGLLQIVQLEKDGKLRFRAMTKLGVAGGAAQLALLYKTASLEGRRSIIAGLFYARADVELIQIADSERNGGSEELCGDAVERLRMLGTPTAKAYLLNVSKKR
jgi:HEAT repeat protein